MSANQKSFQNAQRKYKRNGTTCPMYGRFTRSRVTNCVTKKQPRMWGPSIVGYGSFTYTYASGHSGETALAAFAVRGRDLVVYIVGDTPSQKKLLGKLGKHSMGKSCLYFRRLADIDSKVLEALIAGSAAEAKRRYPQPATAKRE